TPVRVSVMQWRPVVKRDSIRRKTDLLIKRKGLVDFVSPGTRAPLWQDGNELVSAAGDRVPIVRGIPRFVPSADYAEAFGLQWNLHALTQLDSRTGTKLSQSRLERCAGMPLTGFAGLRVLE